MHYLKKEFYALIQDDFALFEFLHSVPVNGFSLQNLENLEEHWVNPVFWSSLGYDPDAMQHSTAAIENLLHSESNSKSSIFSFSNKHIDENIRLISKDSAIRLFRCRGLTVKYKADNVNRRLWTYTDITDELHVDEKLRTQEEKYRNVITNMNLGFLEVDNDDVIIDVNQNFSKISGYSIEELKGKKARELFLYKEGKRIMQERNRLRLKGYSDSVELPVRNKKGEKRWWLISGAPNYNDQGEVIGSIGIHLDVTEQKKAKIELDKAIKEAKEANKAKSEFLANMTHEIRTPLNGIIGFTELMLKTPMNENQRQYMSTVHHSANSLMDIIKDILDFSKIESGKVELDLNKVQVRALCEEVADIIKFQAHHKGLELILSVPHEMNCLVWVDNIKLRQVLVNLLSNAIKFTDHGEVELKVEWVSNAIKNGKARYRFSVRDTGIGIAPDNQKRIFEAFLQEDNSTTRKFGGTGLGLTIANKLLGLMDSKLELISNPENGSTFYFDVPLEIAEEKKPESLTTEINKALVSHDNDISRELLDGMLKYMKVQTVHVQNCKDTIKELEIHHDCEVLLLDVKDFNNTPAVDLKKLQKVLQSHPKQPPVLLFYNSVDDHTKEKLVKLLNVKYSLVKPVKLDELYNVLTKLYTKKSSIENEVSEDQSQIYTPLSNNDTVQKQKVLLVEDNAVNMLLIKTLTKQIMPEAAIIEAENGEVAVEKFKEHKPELVLMDIQMPVMSGYDATIKIREIDDRNTPIIAISAGTLKGEKDRCLKVGMNEYLPKPIIKNNLVKAIKKLMKNS